MSKEISESLNDLEATLNSMEAEFKACALLFPKVLNIAVKFGVAAKVYSQYSQIYYVKTLNDALKNIPLFKNYNTKSNSAKGNIHVNNIKIEDKTGLYINELFEPKYIVHNPHINSKSKSNVDKNYYDFKFYDIQVSLIKNISLSIIKYILENKDQIFNSLGAVSSESTYIIDSITKMFDDWANSSKKI